MSPRPKDRPPLTEDVVRELALIAFADPRDLLEPNGQPKALDKLTPEQAAAIKVVRRRDWTNKAGEPGCDVSLELHDKLKALQLLGDNLGAWTAAARPSGARVFILLPGAARPVEIGQDGRPLEISAGEPAPLETGGDGAAG